MKKIYLLLLALIFSTLVNYNELQAQTHDYRFQALLLKTFMQNTDWPPSAIKSEVKIAVLGSNSVVSKLKTGIKTIKGKPVKIVKINNLAETEKYNLVFITSNYSNKFYTVQKCCKDKPVVIVTEKEGLGKSGSCFNIVPNPQNRNKLAFEINQVSVQRKGLNVSQRISKIALKL